MPTFAYYEERFSPTKPCSLCDPLNPKITILRPVCIGKVFKIQADSFSRFLNAIS